MNEKLKWESELEVSDFGTGPRVRNSSLWRQGRLVISPTHITISKRSANAPVVVVGRLTIAGGLPRLLKYPKYDGESRRRENPKNQYPCGNSTFIQIKSQTVEPQFHPAD